MRSRPLSAVAVVFQSDDSTPGLVPRILEVLWFVAGAAMLVFTLFLAVLIVAGIGFRLAPRTPRRRPRLVFTVSSAIVILCAVALLLPSVVRPFGRHAAARGATAAAQAGAHLDQPRPARTYPAVSGLPLRYAKGGSSGDGVRPSQTRTLVLYDGTGPDASGSEVSATKLANLVSHFGAWTARPVGSYRAGEMTQYDAVFYLGATTGAALPAAFLDDVLLGRRPVMWINGDIEQLKARSTTGWTKRHGFTPIGFDPAQVLSLQYKGVSLPMNQVDEAGLMRITVDDPRTATVLATAVRADGSTLPWAVRSGTLIYVSENPLPYIAHDNDRYLAFADLLFEVLDPDVATRHRALIRLEDVGPTADPAKLMAVTDYLFSRGVPFSVGVYPVHRDPNGAGGDVTIRLSERPALVAALRHAISHGGSLVMHGYTHQYASANNPHNGRSAEDAEFYLTHHDEKQQTHLDGPVPEDSEAWALNRIDQGLEEFRSAGLQKPQTFEFPHYMASPVDYVAAGKRFDYRYERSLYFPGLLSHRPVDDSQREWQFFPYTVRDVYGAVVIPENLDYVSSGTDSVPAMIDEARSNLVVRDGVASFFYHPFLGVGELPRLVEGIQALGYTFVGAQDLAAAP